MKVTEDNPYHWKNRNPYGPSPDEERCCFGCMFFLMVIAGIFWYFHK